MQLKLTDLKPYDRNSRHHSPAQIEKLKRALARFGQIKPVVVWGPENQIAAGHGIWQAMKELGWTECKVERADHLSEVEMRAYVISDNKIAEESTWIDDLLKQELLDLSELKFDVELTGFSVEDIADQILEDAGLSPRRETEEIEREVIGDDDRELTDDPDDEPAPPGEAYDPREDETEEDAEEQEIPSARITAPERVRLGDVWKLGRHTLVCGDSGNAAIVHAHIEEGAAHALVSDPPYGLSFMGKDWDRGVPSKELWKVWESRLKPGAMLLSFSGTRTYHRMTTAIEDAGFEVRDMMQWLYGQGFPKSMDISKAIDKEAGAEREILSKKPASGIGQNSNVLGGHAEGATQKFDAGPATPAAKQWSGWGTALKPANEPICLARKPISEKSVAKNVLKYGTGGLNIEGCRIGSEIVPSQQIVTNANMHHNYSGKVERTGETKYNVGRFPANVILSHAEGCERVGRKKVKGESPKTQKETKDVGGGISLGKYVKQAGSHWAGYTAEDGTETVEDWNCVEGCAVRILDEQSGVLKGGVAGNKSRPFGNGNIYGTAKEFKPNGTEGYGDTGGASRFFYVAKSSRGERGEDNVHATVKPIRLMEYLIKLVTPEGGTVLEPFAGSGTTILAAERLGMSCQAFELDPKHCDIILSRFERLTGFKPEKLA